MKEPPPVRKTWTGCTPTVIVHRTGKYVERIFKDKFILKKLDKNEFLIFENVTFDIYRLIDGNNSIEKICAILLEEYDVTKEMLTQDIYRFIEKLIDYDVVCTKERC